MRYEDLLADAAPADDAFRNGEDLAGIFYTGGTTGFPKGVMLPHRALWASAICFATGTKISTDDRLLHAAPLFHIAGSAMLFSVSLFGGSHVFILRASSPMAFLRATETHTPDDHAVGADHDRHAPAGTDTGRDRHQQFWRR